MIIWNILFKRKIENLDKVTLVKSGIHVKNLRNTTKKNKSQMCNYQMSCEEVKGIKKIWSIK